MNGGTDGRDSGKGGGGGVKGEMEFLKEDAETSSEARWR